ncbi:hypothetical protein CLIB1423_01S08878 [[Candida] railenensis]|uniref:Uncharacterized protein n=1 Tax=[Candida] railenensis TaxID=45579 RepID=A0A9P0VWG1_9ASCO|nr:hypothetical protein CLIB1423_01S08878 [[Candida] railenensis]
MYQRSRNKLAISNTLVLFCTMVLLIALLSTGGESTYSTMYWSKFRYYDSYQLYKNGQKIVWDVEWWTNYAACDKYYHSGNDPRLECSEFVFGYYQPNGEDKLLKNLSIAGLSMLFGSLAFSLMSFIPSVVFLFKSNTFSDLCYFLIIVIIGFVTTFAGVLVMTITHKIGINNIQSSGSGTGKLGPSFALAWLSVCLYLISMILTVIIFRTRGKRKLYQESISDKGNESDEAYELKSIKY